MAGVHPLAEKATRVELLLLDCDGVLTDGGVILGSGGAEFKRFDIQDGMGISLAREAGLKVGILTGRVSDAVRLRSSELRLDEVVQGSKDKIASLDEICQRHELARDQVAYMGDDLQDLEVLLACGLAFAPANARPEVRARVAMVTQARGGMGAVREVVEALLQAKGLWHGLLEKYGAVE